jgi:hypothetical protein
VVNSSSLSPDDLPPTASLQQDDLWRRELEQSIGKHFYESCNGVMQALLMSCEWDFTTQASALTLVIGCPDRNIYERVLNNITAIGTRLELFMSHARIHIDPPVGQGSPLEVWVSELSIRP